MLNYGEQGAGEDQQEVGGGGGGAVGTAPGGAGYNQVVLGAAVRLMLKPTHRAAMAELIPVAEAVADHIIIQTIKVEMVVPV